MQISGMGPEIGSVLDALLVWSENSYGLTPQCYDNTDAVEFLSIRVTCRRWSTCAASVVEDEDEGLIPAMDYVVLPFSSEDVSMDIAPAQEAQPYDDGEQLILES